MPAATPWIAADGKSQVCKRACRNILSFTCLGAFRVRTSGRRTVRWVRTRVHGQSFLLNQIRKMVGLAIAVYRGTAPEGAIHRALDPCLDFSTPMAPELGLFLCECKFATYNERFGKDRDRLDLSDWHDEVEKFKLVRHPLAHAQPVCTCATCTHMHDLCVGWSRSDL